LQCKIEGNNFLLAWMPSAERYRTSYLLYISEPELSNEGDQLVTERNYHEFPVKKHLYSEMALLWPRELMFRRDYFLGL
jgi:hypothetical protein